MNKREYLSFVIVRVDRMVKLALKYLQSYTERDGTAATGLTVFGGEGVQKLLGSGMKC